MAQKNGFHNVICYGSFLSKESLSRTIPSREGVPVIVKGYRRVFNLKPSRMQLYKDGARDGQCAVLNVMPFEDSFINALMIEVDDDEFEKLKIRERSYYTKEVNVFDISGKDKIGKAELFIGRKLFKGERIVDDGFMPIPSYLETVKKAAYSISEDFGNLFEDTTFLGDGRNINDLKKR